MWRDGLIAIIQYVNLLYRLLTSVNIVKKQVGLVCENIAYVNSPAKWFISSTTTPLMVNSSGLVLALL